MTMKNNISNQDLNLVQYQRVPSVDVRIFSGIGVATSDLVLTLVTISKLCHLHYILQKKFKNYKGVSLSLYIPGCIGAISRRPLR